VGSFLEYLQKQYDDLLQLAWEHALVTIVSVGIGTVIALTVGILVWNKPVSRAGAVAITGAILTIPSFALLGLLIPAFGLGWTPTVIALVLYSLLPITRNTVVGMREVDPAILEAGTGLGMSTWTVTMRVQLPLAWPVILTGIRVSAQLIIGIAAIAAYVLGPGLGEVIFSGLSRLGSANALNQAIAGTVGVIILALIFDAAFVLVRRLTTSRGLRA
jgi:osmoprotectant transport system permease protein